MKIENFQSKVCVCAASTNYREDKLSLRDRSLVTVVSLMAQGLYPASISADQVGIFNVTFEPGCRNNWHIHHAKSGGGQILICVSGRGYYQEWGKKAQELFPGDVVNIPAGVKHWHGATPYSWFSHLAVEVPAEEGSNEWLEPVDEDAYMRALC